MLLFAKDDLKGSKKTETEKSTTVPIKDGDGPLSPPKPVSYIQFRARFVLLHVGVHLYLTLHQ